LDIDTDVLIIGGGMAGLVAGIRSLECGVRTTLVRRGQSATAHSSGAIDIAGYLPGGTAPLMSAREGVEAISEFYPLHPYSILGYNDSDGAENDSIKKVEESTDWLIAHLKGTPAQLFGGLDANTDGVTLLGTRKPTAFMQLTQWPGELSADEEAILLFVGIRGLPVFNAKTAAKAFFDNQTRLGDPPHKVANFSIELKPFGNDHNLSTTNLARYLEDEENLNSLQEQVTAQADKLGATHIALPPILGLEMNHRNQNALQEAMKAKVFELLAFPPSVPGLRLQNSLDRIFVENGGTLLIGHEVEPSKIDGKCVKDVVAKSPRRRISIKLKSAVLASGKFIGSGLGSTVEGLYEPIFNLMTVTEGFRETGETRPQRLTNPISISPQSHTLFGCGLSVDPYFRPVSQDGDVTAENLFAAGSILAGYNYAMEKNGLGVALTTGYFAGETSARVAKEGGV
jgi:glycerol-3-phosphate dehydrogenase subunit B